MLNLKAMKFIEMMSLCINANLTFQINRQFKTNRFRLLFLIHEKNQIMVGWYEFALCIGRLHGVISSIIRIYSIQTITENITSCSRTITQRRNPACSAF